MSLVHPVTILSRLDVFLSLEKLHVKKIASQWNKKNNYQTLERGDSISVLKTNGMFQIVTRKRGNSALVITLMEITECSEKDELLFLRKSIDMKRLIRNFI